MYNSGVKHLSAHAGDMGLIPGSGRSPGGGNGNPLKYSCQDNSVDRGAWWATVHGVAKSGTPLSDCTHTYIAPLLQKEWIICGFLHVAHGSLPLFVCTCCFLCPQFSSSFSSLADTFYSLMIHFRRHILLEAFPGPVGWVKSLPLLIVCCAYSSIITHMLKSVHWFLSSLPNG